MIWRRHAWSNRLQSLLLLATLLGISALAGSLLLGSDGMWMALVACLIALLVQPAAGARLTLALYQARPLPVHRARELWQLADRLAARAGLPVAPLLYLAPSPLVNAFAVGQRRQSAIALSDGLLRSLSLREIAGVMAHEIAHIANGDLRVMNLADYVSRLTALFAAVGQILLLLLLPLVVVGSVDINLLALLLLAVSPHLALLAQLGLSRVREFHADLEAARLTGDPAGLASALAKIEGVSRSWRSWFLPGWGNPEPSWLRTHPATGERVARLLSLARESIDESAVYEDAAHWPGEARARRKPRWYPGGYWY